MKVLQALLWTSMGAAALVALGCERDRRERVYVRQQPQYVEPPPQYVIVQQAPPPLREERRGPPPSSAHVWIGGYWSWDNRQYVWEGGRYAVPPQPDVIWVAPRYDNDPHGVRYTPGQWARQNGNEGRGRGGN